MQFDGFHWWPLIGAAAATTVYVTLGFLTTGKKVKRKPRRERCPGLVNNGNSCFLNATLQALAPCVTMVQWLSSGKQMIRKSDETSQEDLDLTIALSNVLSILNNDSIEHTEQYAPSEVLEALLAKRWIVSPDQQDAHEMFHVLTETLSEESASFPSVVPLFDITKIKNVNSVLYQSLQEARSRTKGLLPVLPPKDSDHPFRGLLASQLQCRSCSHKYPIRYDAFDSLSLNIPQQSFGRQSLDALLKHFFLSTTVHDVSCEGCAKKMKLSKDSKLPQTSFYKKQAVGKLPRCLCIHIQRTTWNSGHGLPMKRYDKVDFPEVVDLSSFVSQRKRRGDAAFTSYLDRSLSVGLLGGTTNKNGFTQQSKKHFLGSRLRLSAPYPQPVNLLKALHYSSRAAIGGLTMNTVTSSSEHSPLHSRPGVPPLDDFRVRQLAQAYNAEAAASHFAANDKGASYKLCAVLEHLGDVDSGHFTTYRRAPSSTGQRFPKTWLYTSDTDVRKCELNEVLAASGYILFYERI